MTFSEVIIYTSDFYIYSRKSYCYFYEAVRAAESQLKTGMLMTTRYL